METLIINPQGVCARKMTIVHENGLIVSARVDGGCKGNLQGICRLIEGLKVEDVVKRLDGVICHGGTSCPDQLAQGLKALLK
jgi:uncharacterized protein (TIGR03905 family)